MEVNEINKELYECAFIEKAREFLTNEANIPLWEGYNGTFGCDTSKLVQNFINYIKGE